MVPLARYPIRGHPDLGGDRASDRGSDKGLARHMNLNKECLGEVVVHHYPGVTTWQDLPWYPRILWIWVKTMIGKAHMRTKP